MMSSKEKDKILKIIATIGGVLLCSRYGNTGVWNH